MQYSSRDEHEYWVMQIEVTKFLRFEREQWTNNKNQYGRVIGTSININK